MKLLIPSFPRQVATPRRRNCLNQKEFYNFITQYNGIKNLYYSLYKTDVDNNILPNIDKIFFDFDGPDLQKVLDQTLRFSKALKYKHLILFSGKKGFHVYIFTKNGINLNHPKDALYNVHQYIKQKYDITPDEKIFGDINRIARIPNTMHIRSRLFCIPVKRITLNKGAEHVIDWARRQHTKVKVYAGELLDMKQFDKQNERYHNPIVPEYDYDLKFKEKMLNNFLPCVQLWLKEPKKYCKNETRFLFALYCCEIGLPPKICLDIAKKYWSKTLETDGNRTKYDEFIQERQIVYGYKSDKPFPNCQTLYSMNNKYGFCKGKCKYFKKLGSPLYK